MPSSLAGACGLHPRRAAVAACNRCRRGFCRECIVEHQGRMLCPACIELLAAEATHSRVGIWLWIRVLLQSGFAIFAFYMVFYVLDRHLARIPPQLPLP